MGSWFMVPSVWTLFLALGNATVNISFPSALGRVEITALTQLFWKSAVQKVSYLHDTTALTTQNSLTLQGKSTQSLIPPGWVKVTHENLFCIETKPNCIVKSLSCFYCNLYPNASKCPLGTKKSCWEQLRTASVKSSSNQVKWSFASTFMFDKRLGFTLALIQQQETIIWWQRSPPLTLSLK